MIQAHSHTYSYALHVQGLELSLCGSYLKRDTTFSEAQQLFEAHRVTQDLFQSKVGPGCGE